MIISILVNRFLIRKIFALWEEKKKTLTFDHANRVAILIGSLGLLGMANAAQDPAVFHLIGCDLKAVSSHWCWIPYPWLVSRVNNNNHYLLSTYYVPDVVSFLMHHLN